MVENAIFLQIFHTVIQLTVANSGHQKPQPPKHHHHTTTTTPKIKITQNTKTQIKPRKKKSYSGQIERRRKRGRTIGFGVEDDRFWGATIAIGDDESVLRLRQSGTTNLGSRSGTTKGAIRTAIGDDEGYDSNGDRGRRRVRFERRSARRRSRMALGSGFVLFLGLDCSLSLLLRLFASCVLLRFG